MFNHLDFVRKLEEVGVSRIQAERHSELVGSSMGIYATKEDIKSGLEGLRLELKNDIADVRNDLSKVRDDIAGLGARLAEFKYGFFDRNWKWLAASVLLWPYYQRLQDYLLSLIHLGHK